MIDPKESLINKAKKFARIKHRGQIDDHGKNYFHGHLEQVAEIMKTVTKDPELIAAAYLHDTLEDTDTTHQDLVDRFGQRVADLVYEVTHEGKKDEKGYYFPRLESKDAILLKFADRLSNLSRMDCWPKGRQEQYLRKSKFWRSE
jgi:guanosine-3',5'-bis(diphosphate) 3'-pyrophosphohydrolase